MQQEAWIAKQPELLITYLVQYMPALSRYHIVPRVARKYIAETMSKS
jgi:hypothetical protein